ncbi:hypothetical protein YC2023_079156 [Brassica napus]
MCTEEKQKVVEEKQFDSASGAFNTSSGAFNFRLCCCVCHSRDISFKKSNETVGTGGESILRDENGNEAQAPPSSMPTYCDAPLPDDEAQRRAVFDWVERKLVVVVEVEPSKKKKRKRGGVGEKSRDTTA